MRDTIVWKGCKFTFDTKQIYTNEFPDGEVKVYTGTWSYDDKADDLLSKPWWPAKLCDNHLKFLKRLEQSQ